MSQIKLKVIEKVHRATIRTGDDKKPEVVCLEELRILSSFESLGNKVSTATATEIGQENERRRKIKLRIHKVGDTFEITLKYIVRDDSPDESLNTDTIQA